MDILGVVILAVIGAVAAVLIAAWTRPDQFRTARSLKIAAPPDRIFPLINDLRQMNTWNPFARRETAGTSTYSGPASGKGQAHQFAGPKSGAGSIEIVEATPLSNVVMRLQMTKPIKCDNKVEFTLVPEENATNVTWAMSGKQPLLAKAMTLFIDCDKMVGREFETGLASLKSKAEG